MTNQSDRFWRPFESTGEFFTIVTSQKTVWKNFDFYEISTGPEGTFDGEHNAIRIVQPCGPIRLRLGSYTAPFSRVQDTMIFHPGDRIRGGWDRPHSSFQLYINPDFVEQMTHICYKRENFRKFEGAQSVIECLIQSLSIDARVDHPSGPLIGETILSAILHYLMDGSTVFPITNAAQGLSAKELFRIKDWIEANISKQISLQEIAGELDISVRHLSRTFPILTGYSPYRYIIGRRVERAKYLIETTNKSLEEIATDVGFPHAAHMAVTFRKILGMPPSYFRNTRR